MALRVMARGTSVTAWRRGRGARSCVALALCGLGVAFAPGAARAQTDEARRYEGAGATAFGLGRYEVAATAYEEAYRRAPLPAIAFSAAQAWRRQYWVDGDTAHLVRARELYRLYLEAVPEGGRREHAVTHLQSIDLLLARLPAPDAATPVPPPVPPATQLMIVSPVPGARAAIDGGPAGPVPLVSTVAAGSHHVTVEAPGYFAASRDWLAVEGRLVVAELALAPKPARLRVRAPEGTALVVDGRRVGLAPLARPLVLTPGRHRLVASARGATPWVRDLQLARGTEESAVVTMSPTTQRLVAWSLLAGAGAVAVTATVTGALALGAEARATDILDRGDAQHRDLFVDEASRYRDELGLRDDLRTASLTLGAGAVALVVAWALAYWFDEGTRTLSPSG